MSVVVLGHGPIEIDPTIAREGHGHTLAELVAGPPDAAVIAEAGEAAFFRASLALERGVRRVVLRKGAVAETWVSELAARASVLGGEVFVRGDDDRYVRAHGTTRIEVASPSFDDDVTPALDGEPMPLVESSPGESALRCEELAFAIGLKPVLYLVASASEMAGIVARHPRAVVRADRSTIAQHSGERTYGVGEEVAHVFIGDKAESAAELWAGDSSRNVEPLGALMGYPSCCVRAFAGMASRRINAAFPYVTAARTRAFGGRFDALLDVTTARLIPFVPCSYDCPRAIVWASAVAEAAGIVREARPALYIDEARAISFDAASLEGDTLSYRGARWAAEPNLPLQRAFGALFSSSGRVRPSAVLPRSVFLPFSRLETPMSATLPSR